MTFFAGILILSIFMSLPDTSSFREGMDASDSRNLECETNAMDGRKNLSPHSYGEDEDVDYDTDDVAIHCRKKISLSPKARRYDPYLEDHLSREANKISGILNQNGMGDQKIIVHSYHPSLEVSQKISSAIKTTLSHQRFEVVEHEPHPFLFTRAIRMDHIRSQCIENAFNQSQYIRVFAFKDDKRDSQLKFAICRGNQWIQG